MTILLILFVLFAALVVSACCKVSGRITRMEDERDPCEFCLRWEECNGVDEDCPIRGNSK